MQQDISKAGRVCWSRACSTGRAVPARKCCPRELIIREVVRRVNQGARRWLRPPPARRCRARRARSRNRRALVASPAKNIRFVEGLREPVRARRVTGQRVAVGATNALHLAPAGRGQRTQRGANARAKQCTQLLDREVETGGETALFAQRRASPPKKHSITGRPAAGCNRKPCAHAGIA